MTHRPYLVRGAMGTSEPTGPPGAADRAQDRSSGPAAQVARDQARLRASQAAVASEVIEFQLARELSVSGCRGDWRSDGGTQSIRLHLNIQELGATPRFKAID